VMSLTKPGEIYFETDKKQQVENYRTENTTGKY
jgi:hypothetical protein